MAGQTVIACLDGSRADMDVIDLARHRALVQGSPLTLVSVADPYGQAISMTTSALEDLTGLQVLCRSGDLLRPPLRRGSRLRARRDPLLGGCMVLAEAHYRDMEAIDLRDADGRPGALMRVQPRWDAASPPRLVGVCVTSLRDAACVLRVVNEETTLERAVVRVVYASGRPRGVGRVSGRCVDEILAELREMFPRAGYLHVVADEPYRPLTELGLNCRSVVIPGSPSIFQAGPDGWRYPDTGCPLIVVPQGGDVKRRGR